MNALRHKIKQRLEKYLEMDKSGIRSHLIKTVLKLRKFTVDKVHRILSRKFPVSRNMVASMVGYIYSKLGILRARKDSYKTPTVYYVKEEYLDIITAALKG
ncbi:DUF2551 domain-containing protein [Methermicoccus shengliensis]|uniref:DUF2551 domain-containing protein n=1 Tax=Methermicoccus shengliensis TaxID=660064 RepID=A0A832VZJ3_9EURY|nr:DUF2551 domain-containing protein [Methermicoccus shengliensis]KUK05081.1 MAG: hypothetical protein XD46_0074 [Euryarchaeota archaeon 55_53]KUK30374.1 MAG: hypothetical protein XD62_0549 [Methanosarcinales archeaon 56_1174]MDN5294684.1 hypothetical protein [Methanosarcinales archaeon]HIH69395.1 DUF2551 domain-containing protein [Methermicoccus shengliensis]